MLLVSLQWSEQQTLYWSGVITKHHCLLYLFSLLLFAFTAIYLLLFLNEQLLCVSQKCARKQLNGHPATAIHFDYEMKKCLIEPWKMKKKEEEFNNLLLR